MAENQDEKWEQALFIQLVMSLNEAAMMQLGKAAHPASGKTAKNLAQAQSTIDLLRMLKQKTRGNLSRQEQVLIEQCLKNLQMNYSYEQQSGVAPYRADAAAESGHAA